MSSIVVECRNKTSDNVIRNGDWTTSLNENILVQAGDQIIVKDSFIDTQQSSSSKILLEDDTTVYMDVGYYVINDDQSHFTIFAGSDPVPASTRNLKPLVLCLNVNGLDADDGLVTVFTLETIDKTSKSIPSNITFTWSNDVPALPQEVTVFIPELNATDKYSVREVIGNIVKRAGGVTGINLTESNLKISSITYQSVTNKSLQLPFIQSIGIDLEKGNYDPDELMELMNRKINANNLVNSDYQTDSGRILQTAKQFQDRYDSQSFSISDPTSTEILFQIKAMQNTSDPSIPDIYLGSSICEFSYSQETKDFEINRLHTPYYDGGNITIQYINIGGKYTTVNKIGGNFINSLYAKNSKGEPVDFWSLQLGFGQDILTDFTFVDNTVLTDVLVPSSNDLIDGVGITGQSSTLDGVVSKQTPLVVTPVTSSSIPADLTIGLKGTDNNPTNQQDKFAYYLVEVGSQFKNEFLTPENNFRSIQQIVNRYYELNSYTSAENGQIIYEHTGEDMLLQSFKCRILTSDKQVPTNIGNDNTLHIEIVKGSKQK